jgi:hypothetical protein
VLPLGSRVYPRYSEQEFVSRLRGDLENARLLVQLLSSEQGQRLKGGTSTYVQLQASIAEEMAKGGSVGLLRWRVPGVKLEAIGDEAYRQLLTGAVQSGFEEFRQRVINALEALFSPKPPPTLAPADEPAPAYDALSICVSANQQDTELGQYVAETLDGLGAGVVLAQSEPTTEQSPQEFHAQLDQVIAGSEGVIIIYGKAPPAWVQAQYVRARKVLAQRRHGIWGALLDGPPQEKPPHGVVSRSFMALDCRGGPQREHIARFVDTLRSAAHA